MQQSCINNECMKIDLMSLGKEFDDVEHHLPSVDNILLSSANSRLSDLSIKIEERLQGLKSKIEPSRFERYTDSIKSISNTQPDEDFGKSHVKELKDIDKSLDMCEPKNMPSLQAISTMSELKVFANTAQRDLNVYKECIEPALFEDYKCQLDSILESGNSLEDVEAKKMDLYVIMSKVYDITWNYLPSLEEKLIKYRDKMKPFWFEHIKHYLQRIKDMHIQYGFNVSLVMDLNLVKKHFDNIEQQDVLPDEGIVTNSEMRAFIKQVTERVHKFQNRMNPIEFKLYLDSINKILSGQLRLDYEELYRTILNTIQKSLDRFELKDCTPVLRAIEAADQMVDYANNLQVILISSKEKINEKHFYMYQKILENIISLQQGTNNLDVVKEQLYGIEKALDVVEQQCIPSLNQGMELQEIVAFIKMIEKRLEKLEGKIQPLRFKLYAHNLKWISDMVFTCCHNMALQMDLDAIQHFLDRIEDMYGTTHEKSTQTC